MGGFVIYDVETTGLRKRFDQILQFAAIRTDEDLNIVEEVELRGRLLPNIVPAPKALHITGARLEDITNPDRPSHFELTCQIHDVLTRWSPATFLGFNSIKFDEEFLRQAFYLCLKQPIFVTNLLGNTRGDVLKLARAAAVLHPDVLSVPVGEDGRRIFRLEELAKANNIDPGQGHDATSDVRTTLALCRLIREGAPDLWSRFMRFANKSSALDFIRDEDAFAAFETIGGVVDFRCVMRIGVNANDQNAHYVFDLGHDIERLRAMSHPDLVAAVRDERIVWKLKINASPIMAQIWEVESHLADGTSEADIMGMAEGVRDDADFLRRLNFAAAESEPVWPQSPYVETQIYEAFINNADAARCVAFHQAPWEERLAHVGGFQDLRLRRLAQRLIYFERPDLMDHGRRSMIAAEIEHRVCGIVADPPWLTLPKALEEIDGLLEAIGCAEGHPLQNFKRHFADRLARQLA
jgi:exodeoxyribonuclease-1